MPIQPTGNLNLANIAGASPVPKEAHPSSESAAPDLKPSTAGVQNKAVEQVKKMLGQIKKSLTEAIHKLNEFVSSASNDLVFAQDKETGIEVVKVIDTKTKEVIRQLPSEEAIQIAKTLDKLQVCLLVRDKV